MILSPGQSYFCSFTLRRFDDGDAANAVGTPTVTVLHNGVADGSFTLAMSLMSTGFYKLSGTIPLSYGNGDVVEVLVTAMVANATSGDVTDVGVVDRFQVGLPAAERNAIADAMLSRAASNVEASADPHSLCAVILATLEWALSSDGKHLNIYRSNGTTVFSTKAVTHKAGVKPIVAVK